MLVLFFLVRAYLFPVSATGMSKSIGSYYLVLQCCA